jgi:hypothetical protein
VTVLDLSGAKPLPSIPLDGWARFIERALATGRTSFLAAELSKRRFDLKPEDLPALGLQLLEELEDSNFDDSGQTIASPADENHDCGSAAPDSRHEQTPAENNSEFSGSGGNLQEIQKAHAAHRQFEYSQIQAGNKASMLATCGPSHTLDHESPEVLEKLELLDDLVYDAISGRQGTLNQLQMAWPAIRVELGEQLLAESREQYLRYALVIWEKCVDENNIRNPFQAIQALDVLCLLFEE